MRDKPRVLVIDDEPDMLDNCRLILSRDGCEVITSVESTGILRLVAEADPDLVLTDLMIPGKDGIEVLREVKWSHSDVPVVVMTAYATVETAVAAMKVGAADYIVKPFSNEQLQMLVKRVLEGRRLTLENRRLRRELETQKLSAALVALSPHMQDVASLIARVSDSDATIMINGESGSGKEVIARAIHNASRRSEGPFIAVNCSALPAALLESELFGHEKGAFTGASTMRRGLIEEAHGGTFLLDEITEMDIGMQAKLLRVLQERKLRRVGGNREIEFDVRFISASNRDPAKAVGEQRLREDLFYRLAVIPVSVPPLRERREDISPLSNQFLREFAQKYGRGVTGFTPQVMEKLVTYHWPGNVRELRNVVELAVSLAANPVIREEDLPDSLRQFQPRNIPVVCTEPYEEAKARAIDQFQQEYFKALLDEENGNISRVASRARVDRKTVYRILKNYGLSERPDAEPE